MANDRRLDLTGFTLKTWSQWWYLRDKWCLAATKTQGTTHSPETQVARGLLGAVAIRGTGNPGGVRVVLRSHCFWNYWSASSVSAWEVPGSWSERWIWIFLLTELEDRRRRDSDNQTKLIVPSGLSPANSGQSAHVTWTWLIVRMIYWES